ncbi:MAG: SRPBCC family protein [Phycisphaeraceae bacterium]
MQAEDLSRSPGQETAPSSCLRYVKQSVIEATPREVFEFHESPNALTLLIPPWEHMRVVESAGSLRPGSRVVVKGRKGIVPMKWVAVHTEYAPPNLFADKAESGPFRYWYHRHHMLDDGRGGTVLRDEVAFLPPLGVVGRVLGGWLVLRQLEKMFAYRHETTKRVVESSEWRENRTA